MIGDVGPDARPGAPPLLEVQAARKFRMTPPLVFGVKTTIAVPSPGPAPRSIGGAGTVVGITATDGGDGGPVPTELVAATEHV